MPEVNRDPWHTLTFVKRVELRESCLENPMDRGARWAASTGSQRVGRDWATNTFTFTHVGACMRAHCCLVAKLTPWTVARQAPPSMGFPAWEWWSGYHFLLQEIFLAQGLNPCVLRLLRWQRILYHWATWEAHLTTVLGTHLFCMFKHLKARQSHQKQLSGSTHSGRELEQFSSTLKIC